jgi:hypothetical protein
MVVIYESASHTMDALGPSTPLRQVTHVAIEKTSHSERVGYDCEYTGATVKVFVGESTVKVYDLTGKVVAEKKFRGTRGPCPYIWSSTDGDSMQFGPSDKDMRAWLDKSFLATVRKGGSLARKN